MRLWRVLTIVCLGLCVVLGAIAAGGAARAAQPAAAHFLHVAAAVADGAPAARTTVPAAGSGGVASVPAVAAPSSAAPASSAPAGASKHSDPVAGYRLGTGDKLHINVFGQQDLNGNYLVDGSGNIQFPLIGQVQAAGRTVPELQRALTTALSKGFLVNPSISIEVTSNRPFYILGEVKAPGQYPYVIGMSVITAVALAGGYTFRADESDVYVRRAGSDKEVELPASERTKVNPGDIIRVPERFF